MEYTRYLVQFISLLSGQFQVRTNRKNTLLSMIPIRLSVRTRVVLQKLINYDPKRDKPIFAQQQSGRMISDGEDDLIQRQKLLAREPEVPEM